VQHHIAVAELFIKTESVTATQSRFQQQFKKREVSSHITLLLWVLKCHQEESVMDSKPQGCPFSAHIPDNVEQVRDAML